jgi:2-methylisocitrate lyase-like PEP mutase family enzyme
MALMGAALVERFRSLHKPGQPLVIPNPWDVGSAKALASLGFQALATTSSGFAATLGRLDGSVTKEEALAHAAQLVAAVDVPVSADLENCYADEPEGVAATVHAAIDAGLAGCSIEDFSGHAIYDLELAVERVTAAVEAAAGRIILTARAENYFHDRPDLADTITRLQRFQEVGADVLYAPGLTNHEDIASVIRSVDRPVNVLLMRHGPTIPELTALGAGRISIGGTLAYVAMGALAQAARELQGEARYTFWQRAAEGRDIVQMAFGDG